MPSSRSNSLAMDSSSTPSIIIRPGIPSDVSHLRTAESSAATIFAAIPALAHHASEDGLSEAALHSFITQKQLWAAVPSIASHPIGFLVAHPLATESQGDSNQKSPSPAWYVAELSVSSSYQRLGIGRALIETFCKEMREEGIGNVVLTTYRDVSWNGPWYEKQGFRVVEDEEWESEPWGISLRRIVDGERGERGERKWGGPRCVMLRKLQ
jgi:ribosomal protein S18 acetylase RimI-like enzyme